MKLHVGASGYACKESKSSFYPSDLPPKRFASWRRPTGATCGCDAPTTTMLR